MQHTLGYKNQMIEFLNHYNEVDDDEATMEPLYAIIESALGRSMSDDEVGGVLLATMQSEDDYLPLFDYVDCLSMQVSL